MKPKLLVVLVIILVALFVASLWMGSRADRPGADNELDFFNASWVRDIKQRFTTRLRIDELAINSASPDGCRLQNKQIIIPAGLDSPCQFTIKAADNEDNSLRSLQLHFASGPPSTLTVRLEQPEAEDALTVNKTLAFGEKLSLEVYEAAGTLAIGACQSSENAEASACTINLTVADPG
ncbi:MAG: hypothetical protein L0332_27325 [Chloroflexi bacterium]|nr:hypothetical protein [Chloroflexota bacterium]MCI0578383.1 hypothetical protein [Chloroflexota bacterium]MCI0647620.1 hypothetical protein [Chloroflexota bacterium]MCI0730411.1 hypothetical protein [Chloroflexota bacterium]